jgi:bile acid-coenzyme A ligase
LAACWKAPTSSGSTGRPKIVKATAPALFDPAHPVAPFFPATAVQLVTAPLWHSAAFTYAFRGLITGHRLMLSEAFDELGFLRAVADHRVNWVLLSPSMIHRLVRVPTTVRGGFDLSSLTSVVHMGAPCAHADKRALIAWLGPHRVIEVYAGSESNGLTMISGTEWLRRPRSVGRGIAGTEIRIVRDDGSTAASGEAGQVWMRRGQRASYSYLGAESRRTADGWDTLGDIGRLDEAGYLTILDRANDLVVFDDHTVYPPAVEHALMQHPLVRDAVVYGADDAAGRQVLAAVVDIGDADVDPEAIQRFAAARLGPDDRPAQITLTRTPIRNQAGKVRRSSFRHNGNNRRGTAAVA